MYNTLLVVHTYCLYYTHIYLYKRQSLVQFQTHRNIHTILSLTFSFSCVTFFVHIFSTCMVSKFFFFFFFFFDEWKMGRGQPTRQSYLGVIIVVPYPLDPRSCWGARELRCAIASKLIILASLVILRSRFSLSQSPHNLFYLQHHLHIRFHWTG